MDSEKQLGVSYRVEEGLCNPNSSQLTDFERSMATFKGKAMLYTGYGNKGRVWKFPLGHRVVPSLMEDSLTSEDICVAGAKNLRRVRTLLRNVRDVAEVKENVERAFWGELVSLVDDAVHVCKLCSQGKQELEARVVDALAMTDLVSRLVKSDDVGKSYFLCALLGDLIVRIQTTPKEPWVENQELMQANKQKNEETRSLDASERRKRAVRSAIEIAISKNTKVTRASIMNDVKAHYTTNGGTGGGVQNWLNTTIINEVLIDIGRSDLVIPERKKTRNAKNCENS